MGKTRCLPDPDCELCAAGCARAAGARRNLIIAAILAYLYIAVRKAKYKIGYVLAISVVSIPLIVFGKPVLRELKDPDLAKVGFSELSLSDQLVDAAGDIGGTYLESAGTLSLYHDGPRFGVDHVYSVLRMIPFGTMGLKKPWPERIVRVSTAYLTGDTTMQDIPPGYLGQCWIDFPFVGFLVMPLLHGIGAALVERAFRWIDLRKSPFYLMAYIVAGFLVAMPLNTGSLDFTCSFEIVLAVALFFLLHFLNTGHFRLRSFCRLPNDDRPSRARLEPEVEA